MIVHTPIPWDGNTDWYGKFNNVRIFMDSDCSPDSILSFAKTFSGASVIETLIFFSETTLGPWVAEKIARGEPIFSLPYLIVNANYVWLPFETSCDHPLRKDFIKAMYSLGKQWQILAVH